LQFNQPGKDHRQGWSHSDRDQGSPFIRQGLPLAIFKTTQPPEQSTAAIIVHPSRTEYYAAVEGRLEQLTK
jgi:hypothetical protein